MITSRCPAVAFLTWFVCSGLLAVQMAGVRVRLFYFKTGKPVAREQIALYLGEASRASTPKLEATTSSDGVAVFRLAEPFPKAVWVYTENGRMEGCAVEGLIPFDDVMRQGVTIGVDNEEGFRGGVCKGDRSAIKRLGAKPGEIVMFVRKLSIWEKMQN